MLKKIFAIILVGVMMLSIIPLQASAEETTANGSFSMLNYNVAGLPNFDFLGNAEGIDVNQKEKEIGETLNKTGIDFIAVQEDFNYHKSLANAMSEYTASTRHHGGVPFGDGLNVYAKTAVYNVEREEWRTRYGVFDEGDELTPKGILYCVIEIADGVYADFYDIHADAFETKESQEARVDNYNQLAEMIKRHNSDRPIIITGDFNTYSHASNDDISAKALNEIFMDELGFKDAWTEVCNGGNYSDYTSWYNTGVDCWGNWDSVEKFLYKDGNGIHLDATSFEYVCYKDSNGTPYSDHNGAKVSFNYTLTDSFKAEKADSFSVEKANPIKSFFRKVKTFFKALWTVISKLDTLKNVL